MAFAGFSQHGKVSPDCKWMFSGSSLSSNMVLAFCSGGRSCDSWNDIRHESDFRPDLSSLIKDAFVNTRFSYQFFY
ncbi:MAG TPA: hypothetical protein VGA21_02280 [Cyclobacteriaceae bacterium]